MDLELTGRVALVMAASSGLGLGAATALAREGAHVCMCARNRAKLNRVAAELRRTALGTVRADVVDVTDEVALRTWITDSAEFFGRLDILVTNTGGVDHGGVDDFETDAYRRALDSTMLPHVTATLATLPRMREGGWGRLIHVTSEAVREPIVDNVLSGTVRSGLTAFSKNVSKTAGKDGVTSNIVAPGYHRTGALETQFGADLDREVERLSAELPVGRIGDPARFGQIVAFLAGAPSEFVTGTVLLVDGGKSAGAS